MYVDLNADVGEAATPAARSIELALLPFVTSINIACGAHAGNAATMRRMLEASQAAGIAAGAHPGYPDPEGQGRRPLRLTRADVVAIVAEQISTLAALAAALGISLRHVKPHGALYNQAAADPELALAIAEAVSGTQPSLRLVGLAGSALLQAGRRAGLAVAAEGFLDRAYRPDGTLVPRTEPGALITTAAEVSAQAVSIAVTGRVKTADGSWLAVAADTLCVHGDTPGAVDLARRIRADLDLAGVQVRAL